jgi:DNA-binding MarR family transcriptional regulator
MARITARKPPTTSARADAEAEVPPWTFLTNHAHVLLCIARDPQARVRDIADHVGITERAVMRIIGDLEETGYLTKERDGRRNVYKVRGSMPLRHPIERHRKVSTLLELVMEGS